MPRRDSQGCYDRRGVNVQQREKFPAPKATAKVIPSNACGIPLGRRCPMLQHSLFMMQSLGYIECTQQREQ
jgi:hypothetical protein